MSGYRVNKNGQSLRSSFAFAFRGIKWVAATQINMKIHLTLAVIVLAIALWVKLNFVEAALVVLAAALVIVAEMINSAIEKVVDLVTGEYHPLAGMAKDAAAGAVLLAAFFSVVIGGLVFLPHLIK